MINYSTEKNLLPNIHLPRDESKAVHDLLITRAPSEIVYDILNYSKLLRRTCWSRRLETIEVKGFLEENRVRSFRYLESFKLYLKTPRSGIGHRKVRRISFIIRAAWNDLRSRSIYFQARIFRPVEQSVPLMATEEIVVDGSCMRLDFAIRKTGARTVNWGEDHPFVRGLKEGDRVALYVVADKTYNVNVVREAWIMVHTDW